MTRILLVRHGETVWNSSWRYQGHADIPLSEKGVQQAHRLKERLKNERIDAFYASDLSRALQTAEIVAQAHQLTVQPVAAIRETNFGVWEGLTYKEIMEKYAQLMQDFQSDPVNTRIPQGESLGDVIHRVRQGFSQIVKAHPEQTVFIAAHGGTIRVIISDLLGMDPKDYWKLKQENTALNVLEFYDEKAIVASLNDVNHLRD